MTKKLFSLIFLVSAALMISGCINVDQRTKINEDGTGTIKLHYWTKNSNVSTGEGGIAMGDDIGGFSFVDEVIKTKYNSPVSEIKEMNRYVDNKDSTTHIDLTISFTDFNKLSEAPGFAKITTSYVKGDDGIDFKYIIPRDTTIQKRFITGNEKLNYVFEFPKEISVSNGAVEKNTASWNKPVTDLADGNIEMTATIKEKNKICGLFGIELPLIIFLGLVFLRGKNVYKSINKN